MLSASYQRISYFLYHGAFRTTSAAIICRTFSTFAPWTCKLVMPLTVESEAYLYGFVAHSDEIDILARQVEVHGASCGFIPSHQLSGESIDTDGCPHRSIFKAERTVTHANLHIRVHHLVDTCLIFINTQDWSITHKKRDRLLCQCIVAGP